MASSNAERLRVGYESLAASGSWPAEPALLGPDFELHQDPMLDNARVFRGADAPAALFALISQSVSDATVRAERFIETEPGEIVAIVHLRGKGKASGIAMEREQAHVWHFDGDSAREMTVHASPREALRALGLEDWPAD